MGKIRFIRLHSTKSPIRLTHFCSRRKTSRLIFLSVSTSRRNQGAVIRIMGTITSRLTVPFAINNKVGTLRSVGQVLQTKTSGISLGATTMGGPSLVARKTGFFKSRYVIITVSTGCSRSLNS